MSARFEIKNTTIVGLTVITRKVVADSRGFLERLYSSTDLHAATGDFEVVQINRTRTARRGTVRGMHFQLPPFADMKLVSCLRGRVFDVAVDIRENSPTFLRWHAEILDEDEHRTVFIPAGFAHGFQALSDDCELLYLHSAAYAPSAEGGLNARDPLLGIAWPVEIGALSERDASHPLLTPAYRGVPT